MKEKEDPLGRETDLSKKGVKWFGREEGKSSVRVSRGTGGVESFLNKGMNVEQRECAR